MSDKPINDPTTYRRMAEPHTDDKATHRAWDSFFEEVYAARLKHRIRDVVLVGLLSSSNPNGEHLIITIGNMGNTAHAEGMLAHALGLIRKKHVSEMDSLAASPELAKETSAPRPSPGNVRQSVSGASVMGKEQKPKKETKKPVKEKKPKGTKGSPPAKDVTNY